MSAPKKPVTSPKPAPVAPKQPPLIKARPPAKTSTVIPPKAPPLKGPVIAKTTPYKVGTPPAASKPASATPKSNKVKKPNTKLPQKLTSTVDLDGLIQRLDTSINNGSLLKLLNEDKKTKKEVAAFFVNLSNAKNKHAGLPAISDIKSTLKQTNNKMVQNLSEIIKNGELKKALQQSTGPEVSDFNKLMNKMVPRTDQGIDLFNLAPGTQGQPKKKSFLVKSLLLLGNSAGALAIMAGLAVGTMEYNHNKDPENNPSGIDVGECTIDFAKASGSNLVSGKTHILATDLAAYDNPRLYLGENTNPKTYLEAGTGLEQRLVAEKTEGPTKHAKLDFYQVTSGKHEGDIIAIPHQSPEVKGTKFTSGFDCLKVK